MPKSLNCPERNPAECSRVPVRTLDKQVPAITLQKSVTSKPLEGKSVSTLRAPVRIARRDDVGLQLRRPWRVITRPGNPELCCTLTSRNYKVYANVGFNRYRLTRKISILDSGAGANVSVSGGERTRSYDEHAAVAHPYTFMRRTLMDVQLHVRSRSGRKCEHAMPASKIWHQKNFLFWCQVPKWMCTSVYGRVWTFLDVYVHFLNVPVNEKTLIVAIIGHFSRVAKV